MRPILIAAAVLGLGCESLPSFINPGTCDIAADLLEGELKKLEVSDTPEKQRLYESSIELLVEWGSENGCPLLAQQAAEAEPL